MLKKLESVFNLIGFRRMKDYSTLEKVCGFEPVDTGWGTGLVISCTNHWATAPLTRVIAPLTIYKNSEIVHGQI